MNTKYEYYYEIEETGHRNYYSSFVTAKFQGFRKLRELCKKGFIFQMPNLKIYGKGRLLLDLNFPNLINN